jgi:hypothetical protein
MAPEKELTAAGDHEVLHFAILGKEEARLVRELGSRLVRVVVVVVFVVVVGGP